MGCLTMETKLNGNDLKRKDCMYTMNRAKYQRDYQRVYQRNKRQSMYALNDWKVNIKRVNEEFKTRAILPRHMYEFKPVLKEMLLGHFKVKIIKKRKRTELITKSYAEIC
jgi:hypothetical protein